MLGSSDAFAAWRARALERLTTILLLPFRVPYASPAVTPALYLGRVRILLRTDPWDADAFARAGGMHDFDTGVGTRASAMAGEVREVARLLFPPGNSVTGLTPDRLYRCVLFRTFLLVVFSSPLRAAREQTCRAAGLDGWQVTCFLRFCEVTCMHPFLLLAAFPSDFNKHKSLSLDLEGRPYCAPFARDELPPDDAGVCPGAGHVVSGGGFVSADTFLGPLTLTKVLHALPNPGRASTFHYLFQCTAPGLVPVDLGFGEVFTAPYVVACGLSGVESGALAAWDWGVGDSRAFGTASTVFRFRPSCSDHTAQDVRQWYGNIDVVLDSAAPAPSPCGSHLLHLGTLLSALATPGVSFWDPRSTDARKRAPQVASHLALFLQRAAGADADAAVPAGACGHLMYLESCCAGLGLSWLLSPVPSAARLNVRAVWALQQVARAVPTAAVRPAHVAMVADSLETLGPVTDLGILS